MGIPFILGDLLAGKFTPQLVRCLTKIDQKDGGAKKLFIDIRKNVLLGWLSKIHLTTAEVLRSDVVGENVVVDVVAVVAPHVVREDVGWDEGVCGSGVGHEVGTTSDGDTAVERGLRIGVEHLGNTQCNKNHATSIFVIHHIMQAK